MERKDRRQAPFGFWATTEIALLCLMGGLAVSFGWLAVLTVVDVIFGQRAARLENALEMARSGDFLWASTLLSVGLSLVILGTAIRWSGKGPLRDYVSFHPVGVGPVALWVGVALAGVVGFDLAKTALGLPVVTPEWSYAYRTTQFKPLFLAVLVVGASTFEEVLFRGFIFRGYERRIGRVGAAILTSIAWGVLHVQYQPYDVGFIVILGLVLGAARIRTGSVLPCIAMHVLANAVAFAEVAWQG